MQEAATNGNASTTNGPKHSISTTAHAPPEYWPCCRYRPSHRHSADTALTPSGVLPTGTKDVDVMRSYTRDEYGLLMVFCNIVWAHNLPSIWQHFAASKVKQSKIHCRQLNKHIEEWGHDYCTEIDTIILNKRPLKTSSTTGLIRGKELHNIARVKEGYQS